MNALVFIPMLLVFGVCVWGILLALGMVIRVFAGEKPNPFPACGNCGYDITGLAIMVCPECGSNLLESGITGTHQSLNTSKKIIREGLMGWTLTCLVGSLLIVLPLWGSLQRYGTTWSVVLWASPFFVWLVGAQVLIRVWKKRVRTGLYRSLADRPASLPKSDDHKSA